jgi:hypothetical protein
MSDRARICAVAAALVLAGCGASSAVGELRFHNQAPIRVINDRRDVPRAPEEPRYYLSLYHFDGVWHKRLDRWMAMHRVQRAVNVNSLDEVPDSTWFTNRIGVRDLTLDEIRSGPNRTGSPEDHKPWVIKSSKVGGITVGFIIVDQRGVRYVLKFDQKGIPELETGADVVLQRILWACGFNVPEDYIVKFKRDDLVLAPDAVIKDTMGNERPLTKAFIEHQLAKINLGDDGTIRGLASQFLPGKPLGGHSREGTREDDPNDTVPHQLRRETRGLYPIFSWLDQTDVKQDNTLDAYVPDPGNPKIHYVLHYLIDFGKGLGCMGYISRRHWIGFTYIVDFGQTALSAITLGLWRRPWEGRHEPDIVGAGILESDKYDPGHWKAFTPAYFPFHDADRFDKFWGAKILIRFTRAQLRAAVGEGRYTDPRATDHLTEQLIRRQRKTASYWFDRVNPLDRFEVERAGERSQLCFDDLSVKYALTRGPTRYSARAFDGDGRSIDWHADEGATKDGRTCLHGLRPSPGRDGYTIIEIRTSRPGTDLPPTLVHLATDPKTRHPRVIGLRRQ